MTGIM